MPEIKRNPAGFTLEGMPGVDAAGSFYCFYSQFCCTEKSSSGKCDHLNYM